MFTRWHVALFWQNKLIYVESDQKVGIYDSELVKLLDVEHFEW